MCHVYERYLLLWQSIARQTCMYSGGTGCPNFSPMFSPCIAYEVSICKAIVHGFCLRFSYAHDEHQHTCCQTPSACSAETLILPVGNILVQPSCTGIILEQLVGSNWNSVSSSSLGIAATMISLGPSSGFVAAKRSRNQARSKVTKPEVVASTNSSFEVVPVSVSATLAPRQASIELA